MSIIYVGNFDIKFNDVYLWQNRIKPLHILYRNVWQFENVRSFEHGMDVPCYPLRHMIRLLSVLFLRLYQKHTMYLPAQLHAWTALIVIANHMCLNRLLHMPNQCVWLVDKNNRDAWLVPRDVIWYMHGIYIIFIYQSHALIWPMKQPVRAHVAGNHN